MGVADKATGAISFKEVTLSKDEGPRPDTSAEGLAALKPVRGDGFVITAGNASQLSDGASASVIMSDKEANNILSTMRAREVAVDVQPWSRRFRVYTEMIKSGSPIEIAKVLRDMNRLKFDKDLSFGERRLLDQARSLLLKELAFAKKKTEAEMAEEIKRIFSA